MSRSPHPSILARVVLGVWLLVAAVLAADDLPALQPVAQFLAPARRGLGISQSWSMFAPNPPRATYWLEVEGRRGARWHTLDQPGSTPLEQGRRWRYSRASKYTRGLVAQRAKRDRGHLAQWWCTADDTLSMVRFIHVRLPASPPGVAVSTGPISRTPLEQHRCR